MTQIEEFARVFGMPAAMAPHVDLVASPKERELVLTLSRQVRPQSLPQIATLMNTGRPEIADLLDSAVARGVVDKQVTNMTTTYSAGEFYRRLTLLSVQDTERWGAVPAAVRQEIMDWHLEENIRHHDLVHKLELLDQDPDSVAIHNRDILLLEEALAIVEAAELHVVVTCDCRTLNMACDRPSDGTCIRLDKRGEWTLASGEGTIVSRERCREIVIEADRAGLLHTGQRSEAGRKPTLNGNCCPCCSYPIRAGVKLGMAKKWPRSHYLAQVDWDLCTHCGLCVDRCPFDALERSIVSAAGSEEAQVRVLYRPEECWGCGLCATTCPEQAIVMMPLDEQAAV